jgi:hypothetical protein
MSDTIIIRNRLGSSVYAVALRWMGERVVLVAPLSRIRLELIAMLIAEEWRWCVPVEPCAWTGKKPIGRAPLQ